MACPNERNIGEKHRENCLAILRGVGVRGVICGVRGMVCRVQGVKCLVKC